MRTRLYAGAAVFGAALVSAGWMLERGMAPASARAPESGARLLDQVMSTVRANYVQPLPDSVLYRHVVNGLLRELHDPPSTYLTPERLQRLMERTQGNYAGIGLSVDIRDAWPTVLTIFSGSPAERVGVETGDRIVEVKGLSTRGWTVDETVRAVRGVPGTTVLVVVERPGVSARIPLTIPREPIQVHAVRRAFLLGDGVGYVDVNEFSEVVTAELAHAVDSLATAGMTGLILDLRGNPGGLLEQGVAVSDLFLDSGQVVVRVRSRNEAESRTFTDAAEQRWPRLPVVVLVNGGSASASEIVAGALQDHDRAVVVGTTSYGKGSAQAVFQLRSGGGLKLTTARWFTPSGRSISRPHRAPRETASVEDEGLARDDTTRRFRTDGGREMRGGGGIIPDVLAGDTAAPPAELALQRALGGQLTTFRDAIASEAATLKATHGLTSPAFTVTSAMREALYGRLVARGVRVARAVYDSAHAVVAELLGAEAARYSFGAEAMFRRRLTGDPVLQRAKALVQGARSPGELLQRAAAR